MKRQFFFSKIIPVTILSLIVLAYYWKIILGEYVAMPADLLVGAYFPWMADSWGMPAGVPIKNPLASDIFSQIFIWKSLIAESYRNVSFPLWNPYSYFGYPLLANLQSGALNPANIVFVLFGDINGWNIYVITQRLLSTISMYLFLSNHFRNRQSAIVGSIFYGMSPFMSVWVQLGTMGYTMTWLPLMLLSIEKYATANRTKWLLPMPILIFLLITSGQFQGISYSTLFFTVYFFWLIKDKVNQRMKAVILYFAALSIGIGISAIQIFPTLELYLHSIRGADTYASSVEYGLLPFINLITFFAPDYFGNVTTANYWGFHNYYSTIIYSGAISIFTLYIAITRRRNLGTDKFFLLAFLATVIYIFNSPISRFIQQVNIPLASSGLATRAVIVLTFCLAVLAGRFLTEVKSLRSGAVIKMSLIALAMYGVIAVTTFLVRTAATSEAYISRELLDQANISLRNMVFPSMIAISIVVGLVFRKTRFFVWILVLIVTIDFVRFGWKYESFSPEKYVFPKMDSIEFLAHQDGVFRIEREQGPLLPPNTWAYYRLQSGAGYDPLAPSAATEYYHSHYNLGGGVPTRYAELEGNVFDAKSLGKDNVRFLALLERDVNGNAILGGEKVNDNFLKEKWNEVFRGEGLVIFENSFLMPRVQSLKADVSIFSYKPEEVKISYKSSEGSTVILKDAYFPGWKAQFNGIEHEVKRDEIFRRVDLPAGQGDLLLTYQPYSFNYGTTVSSISLLLYCSFLLVSIRRR